jgi:hypothetical protein
MKFMMVMILTLMSHNIFANLNWNNLKISKDYRTSRAFSLYLDDKEFLFPAEAKLTLKKVTRDNSIKVYIHRFKISICPGQTIESDLELLEIKQPQGIATSVGINLSRGCILEIFVDMDEYKTQSIIK